MPRTLRLVPSLLLLAAIAVPLAVSAPPSSAAAPRGTTTDGAFRLVQLPDLRFDSPVWVGGAGDGSSALYVVEQGGVVWKVVGTTKTRWLDLRRTIGGSGEQGLLSFAFAADFRTSGRVFAYFTLPNGNGQVRQFLVRRGAVVPGSGRVVINVALAPPDATNHNGGNLWSRPGGLLFLSVGDGGGGGDPAGNAQRLDRLTGKLIRVAPKLTGGYVVPRSNPYVGRRGARPEIYALGLRNPWRFSIDAPTGDIWIGDVGQDTREEIDRLPAGRPAGANFGWRRMEGNRVFAPGTHLTSGTRYVKPFLDYGRDRGQCSVTGGVVYRGPVAPLKGWYLYADYCTDTISAVLPATRASVTRPGAPGIVHFGAGPAGNVYVASQQTGRIYRIAAAA